MAKNLTNPFVRTRHTNRGAFAGSSKKQSSKLKGMAKNQARHQSASPSVATNALATRTERRSPDRRVAAAVHAELDFGAPPATQEFNAPILFPPKLSSTNPRETACVRGPPKFSETDRAPLPLPEGEGRGEGERTFPSHRILFSPVHKIRESSLPINLIDIFPTGSAHKCRSEESQRNLGQRNETKKSSPKNCFHSFAPNSFAYSFPPTSVSIASQP